VREKVVIKNCITAVCTNSDLNPKCKNYCVCENLFQLLMDVWKRKMNKENITYIPKRSNFVMLRVSCI
jgi:hypothetical protein